MKPSDHDVEKNVIKKYPLKQKSEKLPENQFDLVLVPISGIIGGSTAYALNAVLPGSGMERTLQVAFCGGAAALLSYLGNKASMKAAPLAARGDTLAIVGVIGWFVAFGVMVGTLSFTGMSYKIVRDAVLRDAGQAIHKAARDVNSASEMAKQVIPAIESGQFDVAAIVNCESMSGCVSGRPGVGREVIKLERISKKYGVLLDQYRSGERNRKRLADRMTAFAKDYERTLNMAHDTWGEKRAALVEIYETARRVAGEIAASLPTSAARGFVGELRGLKVAPARPGRTDVAASLNTSANRLDDALGGIGATSIEMPPFPNPPGIAAGWDKLELTWPLAVFAYLLECAVLYLWFTVYREYVAIQEAVRLKANRDDDDDDFPQIPPSRPNGSGGAHRDSTRPNAPELHTNPIDGPHGWSGLSRFNASKLDGDAS